MGEPPGHAEGRSPPGRVLGLDLGDVRTGVAISDADRRLAVPLGTVRAGAPQDLRAISALVRDNDITLVVVGHPLSMSGRPGTRAQHADQLGGDGDPPVVAGFRAGSKTRNFVIARVPRLLAVVTARVAGVPPGGCLRSAPGDSLRATPYFADGACLVRPPLRVTRFARSAPSASPAPPGGFPGWTPDGGRPRHGGDQARVNSASGFSSPAGTLACARRVGRPGVRQILQICR